LKEEDTTYIGTLRGSLLNKGSKLTCSAPQGSLEEVEVGAMVAGLGREGTEGGAFEPSRCISRVTSLES